MMSDPDLLRLLHEARIHVRRLLEFCDAWGAEEDGVPAPTCFPGCDVADAYDEASLAVQRWDAHSDREPVGNLRRNLAMTQEMARQGFDDSEQLLLGDAVVATTEGDGRITVASSMIPAPLTRDECVRLAAFLLAKADSDD